MSNSLFRQKSIDRISSPEQLNEYIRVSTPSVWLVLSAIVILLLGVCVWGVVGRMDTVLPVAAMSQDGVMTAYIKESDIAKVKTDAVVTVDGDTVKILSIASQPLPVDEAFNEYIRHVGALQQGEWVYALVLDADRPDGVYTAQIVVDNVSPMSFVLN